MAVLVTGMPGVGKSAILRELAVRGFSTWDADHMLVWDGDWRFPATLPSVDFVGGCAPNLDDFDWDAVVLLTAPVLVMLARIDARTDNRFGKTPRERAQILRDTAEVVPLLRQMATVELDATLPVAHLAEQVAGFLPRGR